MRSGLLHPQACGILVAFVGCGQAESTSTQEGGVPSDAGQETSVTDALDAPTDGACIPRTCADLGVSCGRALDGCGGTVECGSCPAGKTCGAGGPNLCGDGSCLAKSCAEVGASCGLVSDGCADVLDCGGCPVPKTCGGGGQPNLCGCLPRSCAELGASCGSLPDGCEGVVECGACPVGKTCGGGGPNLCGDGSCTPRTCAQLAFTCGWASDGCASAIDCGSCEAPDVCGGGGQLNLCGCLPRTCAQLGATCGETLDGCGEVLFCGTCPPPLQCGAGGTPNRCALAGDAAATCTEAGAILDATSGHCYFPSPLPKGPWIEQKAACEEAGAHLATLTSEQEALFVVPLLTTAGHWFGLSRIEAGAFSWVTGEPFEYHNWRSSEPNGYGDSCGLSRTKEGVWQDEPCDLFHTALCERP